LQAKDNRISGLEEIVRAAAGKGPAPVERWNPPYCGDIGLTIRTDGTWTYRGSPIGRMALVKLFARVLRKDADGRTYLVTPAEKVDVEVADAPFLAVEMEVRGNGPGQQIVLRTNVKPYVRVRGRLEALVTRALYYDLVELAEEGEDGIPGLWSGGVFFRLVCR
jgi:hypothetical protein